LAEFKIALVQTLQEDIMKIDDQVGLLMSGTNYGDQKLKDKMRIELKERLTEAENENRPLRIYCGFDPRTSDLHLGHTVPMRKLRQFQELGHEVIFLIGNYTSLIGDPSDKDKLRPQLGPHEVRKNAETYAEQAFKILDTEKTKIEYNAKWLSKLTFKDLINLSSKFTISQFLTRGNFKTRMDKGDPIYLHETFYSIMQGYDAYALKADVQVGGSDQLFNIVTAARKLMVCLGCRPNVAVILDILPGTDGRIKMSKSLGNHIPLLSSPEDMYGKVMSVPDDAMYTYMRLITRWKPEQIIKFNDDTRKGLMHIKDLKMRMAREIVSINHNETLALRAEKHFVNVFQKKGVPEDMPSCSLGDGINVMELIESAGLFKSRSEIRRLINQNAVTLDGELIRMHDFILRNPGILKIGKRRFIRLIT